MRFKHIVIGPGEEIPIEGDPSVVKTKLGDDGAMHLMLRYEEYEQVRNLGDAFRKGLKRANSLA